MTVIEAVGPSRTLNEKADRFLLFHGPLSRRDDDTWDKRRWEMGVFLKQGNWWIDYYFQGRRRREKVGPKGLAKSALKKVQVQIAEGRFLDKKRENNILFSDVIERYLSHTADKKKSHNRDLVSKKKIAKFFEKRRVEDIKPSDVENYRAHRKSDSTPRHQPPTTATINRELAFIKRVFAWGIEKGLLEQNPGRYVKLEKENNARQRILDEGEFGSLLKNCAAHLRPIVLTAYYTAMRRGELLNLKWEQVDLENGFIRLNPNETKTGQGREVPLAKEVIETLRQQVRSLRSPNVFTFKGQRIKSINKAFCAACRRAGIKDFRFHDLRHCAINNWRLQGHDYFRIMEASGHKTMAVFKRYNAVKREELKKLVERSG